MLLKNDIINQSIVTIIKLYFDQLASQIDNATSRYQRINARVCARVCTGVHISKISSGLLTTLLFIYYYYFFCFFFVDIDNMNLWPKLISFLSFPETTLREYAAWVCGTAVQNNPQAQKAVRDQKKEKKIPCHFFWCHFTCFIQHFSL